MKLITHITIRRPDILTPVLNFVMNAASPFVWVAADYGISDGKEQLVRISYLPEVIPHHKFEQEVKKCCPASLKDVYRVK